MSDLENLDAKVSRRERFGVGVASVHPPLKTPLRASRTAMTMLIGGSCPNIACLPSKNIIHGQDWRPDARIL
jgi:hypothetical protein